ncbi:MAG: acyl-CoA thioesterase, partial [Bryobacteraceae bacterium]
MGVAYYANYFVWMELGRVEYCRSAGIRYKDMEENDGILLAVVEASCRYSYPARYDEEVTIRTRLVESNSRMIRFGYEMSSSDSGRKLAAGSTGHVFCGRDMRPTKLPAKYWDAFGIGEAQS